MLASAISKSLLRSGSSAQYLLASQRALSKAIAPVEPKNHEQQHEPVLSSNLRDAPIKNTGGYGVVPNTPHYRKLMELQNFFMQVRFLARICCWKWLIYLYVIRSLAYAYRKTANSFGKNARLTCFRTTWFGYWLSSASQWSVSAFIKWASPRKRPTKPDFCCIVLLLLCDKCKHLTSLL